MFELYKDNAGEFRFRLKSKSGEIILISESYTKKANCENGIESVRKNAHLEKSFSLSQNEAGSWHFTITALNGQVVGTSLFYQSQKQALKGIESVKSNAISAPVKEVTK